MPERSLRKILDELRELLEGGQELDPESREALRDAASEIESALESKDFSPGSQLAALRQRIGHFESSHPRITETVRRLVDQLSEMGI